jgi:hypothetical protein
MVNSRKLEQSSRGGVETSNGGSFTTAGTGEATGGRGRSGSVKGSDAISCNDDLSGTALSELTTKGGAARELGKAKPKRAVTLAPAVSARSWRASKQYNLGSKVST